MKKDKKIKKHVKSPWFRFNKGYILNGRIPIRWQGYLTIVLLLVFNFYNVFYFGIPYGGYKNTFGFFALMLLSIFIFLVIANKKTKGENDS
jgi:hypothetical protein